MFLARDRAGEKPLFYAIRGGELRFASELKGLLADPALERRVDSAALDRYLYEGFVAGEACLLRGVRKLAPAHALEFDLRDGAFRTWRYWQLPEPAAAGPVDEEALVEQARRAAAGRRTAPAGRRRPRRRAALGRGGLEPGHRGRGACGQ